MLQPSGPGNTPCLGWRLKILWPAFRRLESPRQSGPLPLGQSAPSSRCRASRARNGIFATRDRRLNRPFYLSRDRLARITRHKTPANAAFSRESLREREVKRVRGGVRSQIRTRLHLQFPPVREINRKFCDFRASGGDISTKSPVPQSLLGKFPTQINRENILKNREFLSGKVVTGNFIVSVHSLHVA